MQRRNKGKSRPQIHLVWHFNLCLFQLTHMCYDVLLIIFKEMKVLSKIVLKASLFRGENKLEVRYYPHSFDFVALPHGSFIVSQQLIIVQRGRLPQLDLSGYFGGFIFQTGCWTRQQLLYNRIFFSTPVLLSTSQNRH